MTTADALPWSKAAAPIWAHVSGYEHSVRVVKPLAFLQAFSDDSASDTGDRRLIIAGYLNWAEQWAAFSDAWADQLRAHPSICYLKMSEAQHRHRQFEGWREEDRDKKLRSLAAVIEQFNPVSFQFSLSRADFDLYVKPNSPHPLTKPHLDCIFGVICMLANFSDQLGPRAPIDFIFDEQEGVAADVDLFFEQMTDSLPPSGKSLINGKPIFRDDKHFLPLQAADFLAWHLRREHETAKQYPLLNMLRKPGAHLIGELPTEILKAHAAEFKALGGAAFVQDKYQWANIRREMVEMAALGFVPPPPNGRENTMEYRLECYESIMRFKAQHASKA